MNSEGIYRWDAILAPATNIAITPSYTGTGVWDDSATATDYITTYTETVSIAPGAKNVTRVVPTTPLEDVNSPPADVFHLYTGDTPEGFPAYPDAQWFRNRRAKLAAAIRFEVTQTTNWTETRVAIPPFPPASVPADTSGSDTEDVALDLDVQLVGTVSGAEVQWTYNLNANSLIVLQEQFTDTVAVDPFTMKAGGNVDCGFSDSDSAASAGSIPGMNVVSVSGTHSVSIVVS